MYKIGFAGMDGRTFVCASQVYNQDHRGVVVRGMPGMRAYAAQRNLPISFIATTDESVGAFAQAASQAFSVGDLDVLVLMPERLMFEGTLDLLIKDGWGSKVIGLPRHAAWIEGNKITCKRFCARHSVPVASAWTIVDARKFREAKEVAFEYCQEFGGAVLKYPYGAEGKGVRIIRGLWEIREVYDKLIQDYTNHYEQRDGNVYWPLLIESFMCGVEISFTVLVDGNGSFQILPTAMDYPARFSGDPSKDNPVTGGMASISPHPFESAELLGLVAETVVAPFIQGMKAEGLLRPCVLYPGCMVFFDPSSASPRAIRVCEWNIRPGDPEAQPVVKRIRNFAELIRATVEGRLHEVKPDVRTDQISMTIALVVDSYPGSYPKREQFVFDQAYLAKKNITFVPAGLGYDDEKGYFTEGGRVAYLLSNASVKTSAERVAADLRKKLLLAVNQQKVRIIPKYDPNGNRLDARRDAGEHYELAARLMGQ